MSYDSWLKQPENERLLRQEELILSVTEAIWTELEGQGRSKAGLASQLGVSRAHVTQLLNGGRNLTLRSLADIAHALGTQVCVSLGNQDRRGIPELGSESGWYRVVQNYSLPSANVVEGYARVDNVIYPQQWCEAA